jgi:hypothetical protein
MNDDSASRSPDSATLGGRVSTLEEYMRRMASLAQLSQAILERLDTPLRAPEVCDEQMMMMSFICSCRNKK